MTTPKRTSKQLLLALHDQADHDEALEHVLSASDEELEKELAEAGFDLDRLDREPLGAVPVPSAPGDEAPLAVRAVAQAYDPHPDEPRRLPSVRWLYPFAAVLAVAAAVVLVVIVLPDRGTAPPRIARTYELRPQPSPDARRADVARREAFDACRAQRWQQCKGKLDEALALDPAGETAQPVREERGVIDRALAPAPDPKAPPRPRPPQPAPLESAPHVPDEKVP